MAPRPGPAQNALSTDCQFSRYSGFNQIGGNGSVDMEPDNNLAAST